MSDADERKEAERTGSATDEARWTTGSGGPDRAEGLEKWLRLRVVLFSAVLVIAVALVLDVVLVFVLPMPAEVAKHSRWDLLMYSPAALLAVLLVVVFELRPVSAAINSLRLGLRITEAERERALRTALNFPVVLPTVIALIGTAANLMSFVLDVLGRTPWLWYAVHTTVVTQCIIVASAFPCFVYVRSVLRPVVRRLGRGTRYPVRSVGLRGRVALLVATLTALIAAPVASLLMLQLDAAGGRQRERSMKGLSRTLAAEATQMGEHSFRRFISTTSLGEGVTPILVDERGGVVPPAAAASVRRAGLPPPRAGRPVVAKARPDRHVAVSPARLGEGRYAWVGVLYAPERLGIGNRSLLAVLAGIMALAILLALVLGGGLAREIRGLSARLRALSEGEPPAPLAGDIGSLAEIGRVVDGVNDLLAATDQRKLRGFVEIEQTEAAARSKTEFLANMSHDLRAPLTSIIGFSEFLIRGTNGALNPGQLVAAKKLLGSALRLQRTIDELLDTAKDEAGRLSLKRAWTPPATLVSRAVQAANVGAQDTEEPGPQVRIEVDPGLPPIHVDAERTAAALYRLLRALAEEHPGETILLRAATYDEGKDRGVELEVSDALGEALEPPGQAFFDELVTTGSGRRLRLGPALAARVIRRQRGTVKAFVDAGNQGGFRIRFPVTMTGELPATDRR